MRRIIGIGETVLDIIFRSDRPQDAIPGGSTFNALISLGRVMGKTPGACTIKMVTEIGDDHIGDIIEGFMEKNGVGTDFVTRHRGGQSHLSMAFLDKNNDAQYEFYKDHANAGLDSAKVDSVTFSRDDIVLFGSFFAVNPVIREATKKLLVKAREAGAVIYYDINFRKSHIKDLPEVGENIRENCSLADFVRGSAEDFKYLYGTSDGETVYQEHIAPLCRNFILTRGSEPTQVFQGVQRWEFPVEKIETVSTIGAGDNFNAGLICALVRGGISKERCRELTQADWAEMVSVASRFSAAVCQSIYNYVDEGFEA